MRSVQVRITGRVQGVSYRASCASAARARGVRGWVRNDPDGSVLARFEGEDDAVAAMITWCGHGPGPASVRAVAVEDLAPTGEPGFRID